MHVLFLPSWYDTIDKPWRGTFFRDQALAMDRHGVRAGVAFVERRSLVNLTKASIPQHHFQIASDEEDGIPTMRMKGWSTLAQTTTGALIWCALTRRLVGAYVSRYGVPDIIHGHAALWGGYAAMLCARELRRPYVVTEHASSILMDQISPRARAYAKTVYHNARRVLAVSDALRRSVDRIAQTQIAEVVPNAVDTSFFSLPLRRRPPRPFVFLSVGDLVRSKCTEMLIRAFHRLHVNDRLTRLVIVGEGKERERLRSIARSDAIEFTGSLSRTAVRSRMWQANAIVLPSNFETFGVVLIEAFSTGLPAIATRCGGPEEIVQPENGELIPRNDEETLLNAMTAIRNRRFDPVALRESARTRYDYSVVAQRLFHIYDLVLGHSRAA